MTPQTTVRASDWPTYVLGNGGFNQNETSINPATVGQLKPHWMAKAKYSIFSQPVVANGMVYWGSRDGIEHATDLNGKQVWAVNLGASHEQCGYSAVSGIADTATVASVVLQGKMSSVVFVAGGDIRLYALDATTGATIWSTSLGKPPGYFLWSSPVVYNGSVYEGLSSLADCPLVQGKFVQMDAATGSITHTFDTAPNGCIGDSVWGSPTIDTAAGAIYFATGNNGPCSTYEAYAFALVKLRVSDLTFIDSWRMPRYERSPDGDFGSTPTLFTATIGGVTKQLVGLVNKNGTFYTFDRTAISLGPLWKVNVACKKCGYDTNTIAPSAWDGKYLYVASKGTTIGGANCPGSLRALNPATGDFIWEHCLTDGGVFGAVTVIPGVAVVSEGSHVVAIATANGRTLFDYASRNDGEIFQGPASIVNGILYIGSVGHNSKEDVYGNLYAFGL